MRILYRIEGTLSRDKNKNSEFTVWFLQSYWPFLIMVDNIFWSNWPI